MEPVLEAMGLWKSCLPEQNRTASDGLGVKMGQTVRAKVDPSQPSVRCLSTAGRKKDVSDTRKRVCKDPET